MRISDQGRQIPRLSAVVAILIFALSSPAWSQRIVTTIAGGASEDGLPAAPAHLAIYGTAACPDRTVLLSSPGRIYRVTTDGILHVIAGTGVTGVNGDGGAALTAQVWPAGPIACDAQGNAIFADNARIRRIDTHGIVTTVVGDGLPVGSATNGIATQTPIDTVGGIAVDSGGSIYFSEPNSTRVRVVKPDGTVALFAGTPVTGPGDSGDGGPAVAASLWSPSFLAVDPTGNVYIAEPELSIQSPRIRKVTPAGIISTILGGAATSAPVDGQPASTAYVYPFTSMAIDAAGTLYIGTSSSTGLFTAFRFGSDSILHSVPGIAGNVQAIDSAGTVYFTPPASAGLAALPANGSATAFAGASTSEFPDGTNAADAAIYPSAITADASGHLIFAERFTCVIRTVDAAGALRTLAGTGSCASTVAPGKATATPLAVIFSIAAGLDGAVYFTSAGSSPYTVFKIDSTGQISSLNQTASAGIAVDGKGTLWTAAQTTFGYMPQGGTNATIASYNGIQLFGNITAIAPIPSGGIYAFSQAKNLIYTIASPAGISSGNWYNPPQSAAVTSNGDIWIASSGVSRYAAGLGATQRAEIVGSETGMSGDGGPVLGAYFNLPSRLAADTSGGLFLMDLNNRRIRRITGAAPATAPSINTGGVVNSANYSSAFFAPGELITIFGGNLAYSTQFATFSNNRIPSLLGATAVTANGQSIPLLAVSPGQINAVLPQNLQPGQIQLQVSLDGVVSNPVTSALVSAAPALFTADASGKGPGAIVNQDGTVNSAAHPAPRGSIVSIYGTGGGVTTPLLPDGYLDVASPYGLISPTVQVSVGGQPATVPYAGGAPYLIDGAFQMNVQIPATAASGLADLVVSVGSMSSSHISIYIQ